MSGVYADAILLRPTPLQTILSFLRSSSCCARVCTERERCASMAMAILALARRTTCSSMQR